VGAFERRSIPVKNPQSRVWTSIVECISATGATLPPAVIFQGKTIQQQHYPSDIENQPKFKGWLFTLSPKGWIDHELALEWLQRVFIPHTNAGGATRLLIVNSHSSHINKEFILTYFLSNIYLLFLPPYTSHITQPYDIYPFGILKGAYRRLLSNFNVYF
jgi:hypothetical protein